LETVSIVIPCYNGGKFLAETIASFSAQTYSQIEIIIVDDGSDDNITQKCIQALSQPNLKKIHIPHGGPAKARNAGIMIACGKYILPLDADDIILPTYVEKAAHVMDQNDDIGIVYCLGEFFGEKSGIWNLPPFSLKEMLVGNVIFASAMFRRSEWESTGGYNEDMRYGLEDYDFWLSLLAHGCEVYQVQDVLFRYRIHRSSRSTALQKDLAKLQDTYKSIYYNHRAFYRKHEELYTIALREKLVEYTYAHEQLLASRQTIEKYNGIIQKFAILSCAKKVLKKWFKH
jgi:glycosyltransferase involved in cell wall biosynthesis